MSNVYAFQPRRVDPPHFVGEDLGEVAEKVGSFVPGEQCDGCGNSSYQIRVSDTASSGYVAVCAVDPDEIEFKHPEPCGSEYRIAYWGEDEVVF